MNSPKWSGKCGRRASGAAEALAALFACAALAACGSGGAPDVGSGTPPPAGPVNWGVEQTLATNAVAVSAPTAVFGVNGAAAVLWGQAGLPNALPGVPLVGVRESVSGVTFDAVQVVDGLGVQSPSDTIHELTSSPSATGSAAVWRRTEAQLPGTRLSTVLRGANGWGYQAIWGGIAAASDARDLAFAINGAGAQVAVWTELVGGVRVVRLSRRNGNGSWAEPISFSGAGADVPAVALDAAGLAMVVWRQGAPGLIRARTFDTASATPGLELPVDATQIANDGRNPRVVAIGANDFIASWEQAGGGGAYDLRANRGNAAAWLNNPLTVDLSAATVDQARIAAGPTGTAYAVWRQSNTVFLSRFSTGSGLWTAPSQLGVGLTGSSAGPQVAVDGSGNALMAWVQTAATTDLVYALFTASNASLSSAFPLDSQAGAVSSPSLSMASGGAAVVSWLQAVAGQASPNVLARVFRP